MKHIKTFALTLGAACCIFTACNNTNNTAPTPSDQDSTTVADTTIATEEEPAAEVPTYTSDDRKAFSLKGNVKSVTPYATAELHILENIRFDENGKWKKSGGTTMARNDEGFLKSLKTSTGDQEINITCNEHDENGLPTSLTVKTEDQFGETTYKETYTYTEFDAQGNWTKCTVKFTKTYANWDTDYEEKTKGSATLKRSITYF